MSRPKGWMRIAAFLCRLLWLAILAPIESSTAQTSLAKALDATRIEELITLIGKEYVRPLSRDSLLLAVRNGLTESLDRYTTILDPAAWAELNETVAGTFAGVGVKLGSDTSSGTLRVAGLVIGSPALGAGLRVNDVLVAIDGGVIAGRSMEDVLRLLRGPSGSTITLTVRRIGVAAELQVSMRRTVIQTSTVRGLRRRETGEWDYIADAGAHIGYIRIEHFAATTLAEFDRALAAALRAGADALVLDLRVDPGGLARAAVDIADRFLDAGTIFSFRYRDSVQVFPAHRGVGTRLPLAVLIDGYTQSVAELLTASLQDNHRAVVVGTRSWGKGHGQQLFPFSDKRGGLKLTTFALVRPSGQPMERHFADQDSTLGGVWPDSGMAVPLSTEEYDGWLGAALTLDDLIGFAEVSDPAPKKSIDRTLDKAVAVLRARLRR